MTSAQESFLELFQTLSIPKKVAWPCPSPKQINRRELETSPLASGHTES